MDDLLAEGVYLRSLSRSAVGDDLPGDGLDLPQSASGEEQPRPSLAKARATAPPIAPPAP